MIDVRDKKRGNHAERAHRIELIRTQKLGMDQHQPKRREAGLRLRRLPHRRKELFRRGVAIAVGEQLYAAPRRKQERLPHLNIRHGSVAAIGRIVRIRRAHPRGAPLRRAVEKNFHAADAEIPVICTVCREQGGRLVKRRRVGIADHIQCQQIALQQALIDRQQLLGQHALLHGHNAVCGILLLRKAVCFEQRIEIRHRKALLILYERSLLHVPGQAAVLHADPAAVRRRCIGRNAEQCQRAAVEHAHVSGLMLHHERVVRRGGVEQRERRVGLFCQRVVVIALADNPVPRRHRIVPDEPFDAVFYSFKRGFLVQRGLQKRVGRTAQMAVRIDERRQQRAPIQIDWLGMRRKRPQRIQFTDRRDTILPHQQRLRPPLRLQRHNRPAEIQSIHRYVLLSTLRTAGRVPAAPIARPLARAVAIPLTPLHFRTRKRAAPCGGRTYTIRLADDPARYPAGTARGHNAAVLRPASFARV